MVAPLRYFPETFEPTLLPMQNSQSSLLSLGSGLLLAVLGSLLLLTCLFVFALLLALGVGRGIGLDGEERIESRLRLLVGLVRLFQLFNVGLDALCVESLFVDKELCEFFRLWLLPLELYIGGRLVVVEKIAGQDICWSWLFRLGIFGIFLCFVVLVPFTVGGVVVIVVALFVWDPASWDFVLLAVKSWKDLFDGAVLTDELEAENETISTESCEINDKQHNQEDSFSVRSCILTPSWDQFP